MNIIKDLWNKWKDICDKHNKDLDYIDQDNYWNYTYLPSLILVFLCFFLLIYALVR